MHAFDWLCRLIVEIKVRIALAFLASAANTNDLRLRLPRRFRKWRGSIRKLYRQLLERLGEAPPPPYPHRHHPWNRTPEHLEEKVVYLHVEHPFLGAGQLRMLTKRLLGFHPARETIRQIIIRRRDLVVSFEQAREARPRQIRVPGPLKLWGADLTLVWVLGFFPVWLIGVVDYHGSRLIALERLPWPTSARIATSLSLAFDRFGAPEQLLTDRGPVLRAPPMEELLAARGVKHVLTRPAHPWTNGRIERLFRTFKETAFRYAWIFASTRQVDRYCRDFLQWYNRDRPHSSWDGRTPDEVFFDRPPLPRSLGPVPYFDGQLCWYRFG